ncbi:hypothetical protein GW796_10340 [archaeon]|nr:hypothetical protein [archaeon]
MKDSISRQLDVESFFIDNKKEVPATWNWIKNEKGVFYLEANTKKKRYGIIRSCLYCERSFIARHNWLDDAHTCSRFCSAKMNKNRVVTKCSWCSKEIEKKVSSFKNSKHGLHFCNRKCSTNRCNLKTSA